MASSSCWWTAPMYIIISVVLAFIAITTAIHSTSNKASPPAMKPNSYQLSLNASRALRRAGFNIMATFLQISPEIFFTSPNSTIFAIKDSSLLTNTTASLPPWFLKHLLQYHTSPLKLPISELLKKPQGNCFPTVLGRKNLVITKSNATERVIEINHVLISHPDVLLEGNVAIHGIPEPFSSLKASQDIYQFVDSIQAPVCDANSSLVFDSGDPKNLVEWTRIIRLLSSNGFVAFAIGLNSVLDGILQDYRNLTSGTIFTPPDLAFVASPSSMLDKIVRLHVLPRRIDYTELASLPCKSMLRTLLPDQELEITGVVNVTRKMAVNGVEIVAPEIFSSKKFVIHEISRPFQMAQLPNSSQ